MASSTQSRHVNIKCNMSHTGLKPEDVVAWIRHPIGEDKDEYGEDFGGWPESECFWAVHNEQGKEKHFHMVVRFPSVVFWKRLRDWLTKKDNHHYSQAARAFNRSVRYLLHLDNPEKEDIPRECLCFTDNVNQSELSMILGAARSSILADIRALPVMETFGAFDYLVNQKGHSPNEVAQVLRCLGSLSDWIKKVQSDDNLRSQVASIPSEFDPFREESEFS